MPTTAARSRSQSEIASDNPCSRHLSGVSDFRPLTLCQSWHANDLRFVDLIPRTRNLRCAPRASHRLADRPNHLALPHRREARRRRHGRGLQGRGHAARSLRRAEIPARRPCPRPSGPGTISPRGAGRFRTESSQHLHDLRHRRAGRAGVHRHGVPGWRNAEASHRWKARRDGVFCSTWPSRLPMRWMRRTPKASFIATSSRPTFSSPSAATPRFWISVWRSWHPRATVLRIFRRCRQRSEPEHLTEPGHDGGHGGVHVAGAGAGRRAGCAHGFVFVWRGALRDGHRQSCRFAATLRRDLRTPF